MCRRHSLSSVIFLLKLAELLEGCATMQPVGSGNQLTVWNYLFVAQGKEESPLHSDNGNKHFSVVEVVWT